MDINEPSLMDVAHDAINSTQVIVGGSHEIFSRIPHHATHQGNYLSLSLWSSKFHSLSCGRVSPYLWSSLFPFKTLAQALSKQATLNKILKVRLLPASTEEVYFVPPEGHIDRNPER
ncbi:unnamed protein product [Prunus armeniaca]